jgi:hypothetical protein
MPKSGFATGYADQWTPSGSTWTPPRTTENVAVSSVAEERADDECPYCPAQQAHSGTVGVDMAFKPHQTFVDLGRWLKTLYTRHHR